ncbi:MAG: biotin--[acetyl-CoA-carboxylase] ligase [Ekhidna sp.]|nr:biotin--[acetyl-CoA-carboxylase] ligase [Ekhidna sp.]
MHKIFAKPSFLGKKVVFLPQCHSTNDELLALSKAGDLPEGMVLYTNDQQRGKGQRGNIWLSEPGKNITMSLFLRPKFLKISNQHYLNLIVGLGIVDTIAAYLSTPATLKWPNDVYVDSRKISGVLIENTIRGGFLESSIVGIGMNVNQRAFSLPIATSISLESGVKSDLMKVIESLLLNIEKWYLLLKAGRTEQILNVYHETLMWRGEKRVFQSGSNEFVGQILGIHSDGRLKMLVNDSERLFGLKEIEFVG